MTTREFTNELNNRIRITIEGPTSTSENVLTPMEVGELKTAINEHTVFGECMFGVKPERCQNHPPIDMVLHCPNCGKQHIDEAKGCTMGMGCEVGVCYAAAMGEPDRCDAWANEPHRSHLCHHCEYVWRPADVATNGVKEIKTKGKRDHGPVPEGFQGIGLPGHAIVYMNQPVSVTSNLLCRKDVDDLKDAIASFDRQLKRRRGDLR